MKGLGVLVMVIPRDGSAPRCKRLSTAEAEALRQKAIARPDLYAEVICASVYRAEILPAPQSGPLTGGGGENATQ